MMMWLASHQLVALYWLVIFHVHVFGIEPREHYHRLNEIPEPRCNCEGEVSLFVSYHLSLFFHRAFSMIWVLFVELTV